MARGVLLGLGVGCLMAGIFFGAADGMVRAPLFSACMAILAILALIQASPERIAFVLKRHLLSALAMLGLVVWALVGAFWPLPSNLAHPIWSESGAQNGVLSLAPYRTLDGLSALVGAISAFVLGAVLVRTRQDKDLLGLMLTAGGGVIAITALGLYTQERNAGFDRLAFTLGSANAAALVFALIALVSFCLTWRLTLRKLSDQGAKSPLTLLSAAFGVSSLALAMTALLLTASRAGLVVAVSALALLFLLLWRLAQAAPKLATLIAPLVVAGLVALGAGFALERLNGLDAAAAQRQELVAMHWRFFEARPLTGHGLNTFHELHASALDGDNYHAQRAMGAAHNIYVQALEETGLIGFGFWVLALGGLGVKLLYLVWARRPGADWAAATLISLLAALAHGAVDFGLQLPAISAWIALVLGAYSRTSSD